MWLNFRSVVMPCRCVLIHCLTLCVQLIGVDVDGKFSQTIVIIHVWMLISPVAFHSNKCWLSGIVDYLLRAEVPHHISAFVPWVGVRRFCGWSHQNTWPWGSQPHLCFAMYGVIVHIKIAIPVLAHLLYVDSYLILHCMIPRLGTHMHTSS